MRLDIRYRTYFTYETPVSESQNELRACPTQLPTQQLLAYRVTVSPQARVFSYTDYWGTRVDHFGVRPPHMALEVIAEAAVETHAPSAITASPTWSDLTDHDFVEVHREYLEPSAHTDWPTSLAEITRSQIELAGNDVVGSVLAVHRWCGNRLEYRPNETDIGISIDDLLEGGVGVCQDYAHLAVAMCRSVGIPARYVSGYLFTSNDRTGADVVGDVVSVQTHAWMEAAIPGAGWLALDPTNRLRVGQQHVKIGHGRDYDDVQPLRGVFSGSVEPALEASVEIRRMEPGRQPTTAVQPAVPRPVAAERLRYEQQQQQQQQQQ